MKPRPTLPVLAAVLAAMVSIHAAAQGPVATPDPAASAAPRRADGRPDLRGVWMPPYVPDMTVNRRDQRGYAEPPFSPDDTPQARQALYATGNKAELPFTPWGLADWSSYDAATGDYTGSCFPFGLQRSINAPYPFQIMQDEQHVALLFEINTWHHVIPITSEFPQQMADNPTWYGYSIGRWDGDTFVVETRGFNGYTRLDTVGHPHSDALHLTQTFRRLDARRMAYTVTIDDPKTYTRPWTNERTFQLHDGPLLEYSCEENNKSLWDGRITTWTPPWVKPQPGSSAADEAAVRDVVARYMAARDAGDPAAVEALFTSDADQFTTSGEWRRGRDEIRSGTAESSRRNPGSRRISVDSVRFVTPDVAIVDGPYAISAGGAPPARRMWTTIVLARTAAGWRISAIRNMVPTGGQ